jgi:hypothetical protein
MNKVSAALSYLLYTHKPVLKDECQHEKFFHSLRKLSACVSKYNVNCFLDWLKMCLIQPTLRNILVSNLSKSIHGKSKSKVVFSASTCIIETLKEPAKKKYFLGYFRMVVLNNFDTKILRSVCWMRHIQPFF